MIKEQVVQLGCLLQDIAIKDGEEGGGKERGGEESWSRDEGRKEAFSSILPQNSSALQLHKHFRTWTAPVKEVAAAPEDEAGESGVGSPIVQTWIVDHASGTQGMAAVPVRSHTVLDESYFQAHARSPWGVPEVLKCWRYVYNARGLSNSRLELDQTSQIWVTNVKMTHLLSVSPLDLKSNWETSVVLHI